jgi:hypothetical protein
MRYEVNPTDFVTPYMVEFPIFEGKDSIWYQNVSYISFRVFFGPENVNNPKKIAAYEIYLSE